MEYRETQTAFYLWPFNYIIHHIERDLTGREIYYDHEHSADFIRFSIRWKLATTLVGSFTGHRNLLVNRRRVVGVI